VERGPGRLARYEESRNELSFELLRISDALASFEWTLSTVRELHQRLSEEMAREVDAMRLWPGGAWDGTSHWSAGESKFDVVT
jgi:hypothetical protein